MRNPSFRIRVAPSVESGDKRAERNAQVACSGLEAGLGVLAFIQVPVEFGIGGTECLVKGAGLVGGAGKAPGALRVADELAVPEAAGDTEVEGFGGLS